MRLPEDGQAVIRTLHSGENRRVASVRLLHHGGIALEQTAEGLRIALPPAMPIEGPHGIAIMHG